MLGCKHMEYCMYLEAGVQAPIAAPIPRAEANIPDLFIRTESVDSANGPSPNDIPTLLQHFI